MKHKLALCALAALALCSCESVQRVRMEHLVPAQVSFPVDVKNVAVINNVTTQPFEPVEAPHYRSELSILRPSETQYIGGAQLPAVQGLADGLAEKEYFDNVLICDSLPAERYKRLTGRSHSLSSNEIKELCRQFGVQCLICLDELPVRASIVTDFDFEYEMYISQLKVVPKPVVRVYYPTLARPAYVLQPTDSLFWDIAGNSLVGMNGEQVSTDQMMEEASYYAGQMVSKLLLPYWTTERRYLMAPSGKESQQAIASAKADKWAEAAQTWQNMLPKAKGKKRFDILYNLAVASEMQDDLNKAMDYVKQYRQYLPEVSDSKQKLAITYQGKLEKRITEREQLNLQLSRVTDETPRQ